jgi:NAD-binding of NADP-dependent 3-hydroxyisobutyrate dehydrogenase
MIAALSEAFIFADAQGIDPEVFLDTVNSALFQSPLYALYAKTMLNPPQVPGGTVALGRKDIALFRDAAGPLRLPLADQIAQQLDRAEEAGIEGPGLGGGPIPHGTNGRRAPFRRDGLDGIRCPPKRLRERPGEPGSRCVQKERVRAVNRVLASAGHA